MKIRPLYLVLILLAAALIFALNLISQTFLVAEKSAFLMGTPVRVKVEGLYAGLYADMALEEIKGLEQIFSNKLPMSEISLLNRLAGLAPLQVSNDTMECLKLAQRMNRLTGGAFDVTLGDPGALIIDQKLGKAFIRKQGVKIDLGGIGKGFAVEKVRKLLMEQGAASGMIDIRSSIAVFGKKVRKIGIQDPKDRSKILGMVELKEGESLSTSGNYERGNHIIDPRTKRPALGCSSVTVIGKNAAEADALSTAVFVLGPVAGTKLINALPGKQAMVVDNKGELYFSSDFVLLKP